MIIHRTLEFMERNVICMKWGTKYGPHYVNRLYRHVSKNLSGDYRFICFTDDASGIDEGVEVFPIPEMDLDPNEPERGWKKLTILGETEANMKGQVLFLDIDIIVRAPIDQLFEHPGEFLIIQDWLRKHRQIGNSSVFRFKAGAHADVLDYFVKNPQKVKNWVRHEQAYLTYKVRETTEVTYWPERWCVSFKRQCIPPVPICWFKETQEPEDACIVVFHGHPNPPDAIAGIGKGFRQFRPAPWVAKYWD
ncbi:MAG: glycosyltransferase [Opitutales bacterium]